MKGGGSFQAGPLEVWGVWPGPPWSGVCWKGGGGRGASPPAPPPVLDWLAVRDRAGNSEQRQLGSLEEFSKFHFIFAK